MKKSVYLSSLLAICLSLFATTAKAQVPVVTTDPVNDTVCASDTAWFHIAATGASPVTFMWQFSSTGGATWDTVHNSSVYLGATNDTLRVIPTATHDQYQYRCLAFNTAGSDTSAAAVLTVHIFSAGTITGSSSVCKLSSITLVSSVPGGTWSNVNHVIDTVDPSGVVTGRKFGTDTVKYAHANVCGVAVSWKLIRVDTVVTAQTITGPTHVCVGNMITLANVNVVGTGVWSVLHGNASVSSSGVVTGLAAGVDTVVYDFSNACSSVSSWKQITVETLPSAGTITGASVLCAGTWIHLTSSISGGLWLSGAPAVAVVNTNGDVTGVTRGSSIISYYQSNSCGASFSTHTVTVDVVAAAIGGNDSVGIDSVILLSNTTPGGTWLSVDTTIAKLISSGGSVKGMDTGVTTISYSVTNTCGFSYSTITMNVGPLPDAGVITGPDSVCVGNTISLDASVGGGTWTSIHDTLATVLAFNDTTGKVTGVEFGKDTLVYTVTTAFGKKKITRPVFVNDVPSITITGPASVALSGAYNLYATPTGGTWSTNNMAMAPLIGYGYFVVVDTGTSIFTYTSTNSCGTRSKTFTIHLPGTTSVNGVATDNSAKLNVYPNPSQGALTLNVTSSVSEKVSVVLSDVTGRKLKEFAVVTNTPTSVTIDQPAGVYMLTAVTADGSRYTTRISIAD